MKKKWQKRLMAVAVALGFVDKMKTGALTRDEQQQLFAEYETKYGSTFVDDKTANEDELEEENQVLSAEEQQQLASIFGEDAPKTPKEAVTKLTGKVAEQQTTIEELGETPEPDKPLAKVAVVGAGGSGSVAAAVLARTLGRSGHSTTHLFGIENPMFARDKWYNKLMTSKRPLHESAGSISPEESQELQAAVKSMSQSIRSRVEFLDKNNLTGLLNFEKMIAGAAPIDYTDVMDTAGEYIVRRTDLILAYLRSLPSVDYLFPLVSNVQNKEVVPGANFGELSQGYRAGKKYKGKANFTAEIYQVNDLMFKFLFENLIDLEKQYIGYLNREGSDVMKWTFVEWIMTHFGTILNNERNQRAVIGVRVPQQDVKDNPAMFGSDGALRAVERVVEQLKVLPFKDLNKYDLSTIVDYAEDLHDKVEAILPSMEGFQLWANGKHKRAYVRQFREKYGTDNDFTGVKEGLVDISPDTINWIPNMRNNDYLMFITFPGNIERYEDKPNEMMMFYFERDWESLGVMSRWKEGAGLRQAGIKYATAALLEASKRKNQWIFVNHPVTLLAAGATTVDGDSNTLFQTIANAAATNITNVVNAEIDRVYKIVCGSTTNATTVNKTDNFSKIASNWVPAAVGDYIKVYAELEDYQDTDDDGNTYTATRATGKFLELERKVS